MNSIVIGEYSDFMNLNAEIVIHHFITLRYSNKDVRFEIGNIEHYKRDLEIEELEAEVENFLEIIRMAILNNFPMKDQIYINASKVRPYCLVDKRYVEFGFSDKNAVFRVGIKKLSRQNSIL